MVGKKNTLPTLQKNFETRILRIAFETKRESLERGRREGLEEGRKEGIQEEKENSARNLLSLGVLTEEQVAQVTGLS